MTFDQTYWDKQRQRLDVAQGVRHVYFAKFVADQCGDRLRYVENVGWFRWTGVVWEPTGDSGAALQALTDAAQVLGKRVAENGADASWASAAMFKMLSGRERGFMLREMSALREFRSHVDEFDTARHLLTFKNGTVDLRTGELRAHNPADRLTQCARVDYNPDAAAPRWTRFVAEVFPDDSDLQHYYQTFLGYCITGEVREHALGVWYGAHGRNGKGTTIRTMQQIFGSQIVREVDYQLFVKGYQPHTEQIAGLRGARMVVAQEGEAGQAMNTARLKNFSGGDRIEARHLQGKTFSYEPTFTVVLATNHLPEFASGGAALWARTKAILFGQSFADRVDRELEPTIQGPEAEGVAAWIVEGAKRYYAEGLRDPLSVVTATEFHKDSVDPLKELVGEVFDYAEGARVKRSLFNGELKEWRDTNGDKSGKFSPSSVKRHLINSGNVEEKKFADGWYYLGIRLMSDSMPSDGPGIFAKESR